MSVGATSHWVEDGEGQGIGKWMSPLVDARKGQLRTSNGRMGLSATGDDNEKYGDDPYVKV